MHKMALAHPRDVGVRSDLCFFICSISISISFTLAHQHLDCIDQIIYNRLSNYIQVKILHILK